MANYDVELNIPGTEKRFYFSCLAPYACSYDPLWRVFFAWRQKTASLLYTVFIGRVIKFVSFVSCLISEFLCFIRFVFFRSSYFSGGFFLLGSHTRYASTRFACQDYYYYYFYYSLSHCLRPHNLYQVSPSMMNNQEGHWGYCLRSWVERTVS